MGSEPDLGIRVENNDMMGMIKDFPYQMRESLTFGTEIVVRDDINHIIIAGMGGSAIAGSVLQSICADDKTPISVCRGVSLPGWANEKTLVIFISYSGDTDETILMYTDATKKRCKMMAVASGGKLARMAKQDGLALIQVPRGLVPRTALGYIIIPLLAILSRSHLIEDHLNGLDTVVNLLERAPYQSSAQNLARRLAGSTPLIYTTPKLFGVGQRWKESINENAKTHAFVNTMPEIAHNEILALSRTKIPYHAVLLRDDRDSLPMKKRAECIKNMIRAAGLQVTDIELKGASPLAKILSAVHLGDFTAFHLSEEYGVDPILTKPIEEYKLAVKKAEGKPIGPNFQ